jgi:hypothetical protein
MAARAEAIECAALDKRLERFPIEGFVRDARKEIRERCERTIRISLGKNRFAYAFAEVLYSVVATTVKSVPLSLISGGSTGMPRRSHSATNIEIDSVSPASAVRTAAIYSTG